MLKVFTNPANEWVSIDLPSMPAEDYRISLVNPAGQVIRQVTLQGGRVVSLDLQGLALKKIHYSNLPEKLLPEFKSAKAIIINYQPKLF